MPEEPNAPHVSARATFGGNPDIAVRSDAPHWISLCIAPDIELKDPVRDFFFAQMSTLTAELRENLTLALDELLGNSLEHGCAREPKRGVELSFVRTPRLICFHLRDSGPGFSLDQVPHAALGNPPGSPLDHASLRSRLGMRPGGFGILLVKQIADELLYNEHGNEVFFVKYLAPPAQWVVS